MAVVGLGALLCSTGLTASADRYEFRVVGVRRADVLNIRERVESQDDVSDTKVLGRIPAKASGIVGTGATQKVGRTRWYEVRFGKVRGWVNGRFLSPLSGELSQALQSNLFCSGTEPFWSLKVEDTGAEVRQPGEEPRHYSVATREPFQGRSDSLALRLVGDNSSEVTALVQHKEWCNDGMSDLEYAFEVRVVGPGGESRTLRGCCSLLR